MIWRKIFREGVSENRHYYQVIKIEGQSKEYTHLPLRDDYGKSNRLFHTQRQKALEENETNLYPVDIFGP